MVDFELKILETPESAPNRARLIEELTTAQAELGEGATEEESIETITIVAKNHEYYAIWFGGEAIYLWPQSLGLDVVLAFEGIPL